MVVGVENLLPCAQAASHDQRRWHRCERQDDARRLDRPLFLAPVVGGYTVISTDNYKYPLSSLVRRAGRTACVEGSISNEKKRGNDNPG